MERIFLHALVMICGKRNFSHLAIISDQHSLDEEEPDDASFDIEPPPPKIRSFSEVINSLEDVESFLDRKGHSEQATVV